MRTFPTAALALLLPALAFSADPLARVPLTFEANHGQWPRDLRYAARGDGNWLLLSSQGAVLESARTGAALRLSFAGGTQAQLEPMDATQSFSNYFVGATPVSHATHYQRVRYRNVYPGVDAVFYGNQRHVEYDLLLAPGADASAIALQFDGANTIATDNEGGLVFRLAAEEIRQPAPFVYQDIHGQRRSVPAAYVVHAGGRVTFQLGAYDHSLPLVIDPLLIYSTYLGGVKQDEAVAIAVDRSGNIYLAGQTSSPALPGAKGTRPSALNVAYVTKLNPAGDQVIYTTYLGGRSTTRATAIAVDPEGRAWVTGVTGASDFPLMNPVQNKQTGLNIVFISELNPAGDKLMFSTFLGGERNDIANAITLDPKGNVYVGGTTNSEKFPMMHARQATIGQNGDAFLSRISPAYQLTYSSYLGSTGAEEIWALTTDAAGDLYVTGQTYSPNMATPGAFQTRVQGNDAFVAKFSGGEQPVFFTYLGGTGYESARALAVDPSGNVFVAGYTTSPNFPATPGAFQTKYGGGPSDAFAARLSADGTKLLWATFLGGSHAGAGYTEEATALALDDYGYPVVAGLTISPDFPTYRALQPNIGGGQDAFLLKLTPDGSTLVYSTFFGGQAEDTANAIALRGNDVYVAGETFSLNFPTVDAFKKANAGESDAFALRVCDPYIWAGGLTFVYTIGKDLPDPQTTNVVTGCTKKIAFTVVASAEWLSVTPDRGDADGKLTVTVKPQNLDPGEYKVTFTVTAPDAVNGSVEVPVVVQVLPPPPPPDEM